MVHGRKNIFAANVVTLLICHIPSSSNTSDVVSTDSTLACFNPMCIKIIYLLIRLLNSIGLSSKLLIVESYIHNKQGLGLNP